MTFCIVAVVRQINAKKDEKVEDILKSPEFILYLIWISIGNLDVVFTTFNWNQFTRFVTLENYEKLVDAFGNFLWSAALFSTMSGVTVDFFSNCITQKTKFALLNAKIIVLRQVIIL